jgi:glutathione S-transferase
MRAAVRVDMTNRGRTADERRAPPRAVVEQTDTDLRILQTGARDARHAGGPAMITLYTFGPMFDLPDPSPFVTKAEMLLKLAGLEYKTDARGFSRAPKGKLPYIEDDGRIVADSTLIRLHLEKKYRIDFDRGLSARDRGVGWATEKMLEEQLYWVMVRWRWLDDANFARGPKIFFRRAPAIVRPLVERIVRKSVRKTLFMHGIGRHDDADMLAMAERGFEAVSQILGESRYFLAMPRAAPTRPCSRS